jgi:autotransporter-associated beta strand protein
MLSLGFQASGIYTLNGGTLQAVNVSGGGGGGGSSTFNFNGGTLQAGASDAPNDPNFPTTFFGGLTTVNVQTGGAYINTNGYNVTIAQNLLHDTTSGAPGLDGGLTKLGAGTLTLTGTNTFTGPVNIDAGTLAVASESNLGVETNPLTIGGGGELLFTGSATLSRIYNLGVSTLAVAAGDTLTYASGAIVDGGFLGSGGTQAFTNGSSLNGSSSALGSALTSSGAVSFNNVTLRGGLTQTSGALTAMNTVVSSAGTLTVGGTINTSGFEDDGVTTINNGGTLANTGAQLVFGGGSRTTINSGGTLSTDSSASGSTIELNGALLTNNGTQSGTLDVNYGSTVNGRGTFGDVNVNTGGTLGSSTVAGGSGLSAINLTNGHGLAATTPLTNPELNATPGTTNVGSLALHGGGTFTIRVQNATGAAGMGYDLTTASGTLTIASDASPTNQVIIGLSSLNSSGNAGAAENFNPAQNYQFVLVQANGGIVGYTSSAEFDVNTSGFANATDGTFSVGETGDELVLDYSVVPEPGAWATVAAGTAVLGLLQRRKRR